MRPGWPLNARGSARPDATSGSRIGVSRHAASSAVLARAVASGTATAAVGVGLRAAVVPQRGIAWLVAMRTPGRCTRTRFERRVVTRVRWTQPAFGRWSRPRATVRSAVLVGPAASVLGVDSLPAALASLLVGYEARERGWGGLDDRDRQRYVEWVSAARNEQSARRRAKVVVDRVRDGRGWAGPVHRFFAKHFTIPKGTTTDDAWRADQRGDTPLG